MERAAEKAEVFQMSNEQSKRLELLSRFFQIQLALDRLSDPDSRAVLEEQKKELTEALNSK